MDDFWTVAIGPDLQVELLPCAASSTRTWVNQLVTLVQQLGWCRTTTSFSYEQLGTSFYLRESLCRREEVLSAPRISSFWKRSVSLSFLGVFLLVVCVLFLCFGVVLFRHLEDIWLFAFHLFSYNLRIVDRPQDVLMTVRASSAHGMS